MSTNPNLDTLADDVGFVLQFTSASGMGDRKCLPPGSK